MYVYVIINLINGKKYVGKTINNILERFEKHKYLSSKGIETKLYNAIRKYGEENFVCHLLEEVSGDLEELNEREKYWIIFHNTFNEGYNMTFGGDGGDTSSSEKYKEYMSIRGDLISGENNPFYGRTHSEETKSIISQKLTGKKRSEELKNHLSVINTGKKMSKESIDKGVEKRIKTWKITTPSGEVIIIKNLSSFCKENGLDQRNMTKVAAGIYKKSKGYICERLHNV